VVTALEFVVWNWGALGRVCVRTILRIFFWVMVGCLGIGDLKVDGYFWEDIGLRRCRGWQNVGEGGGMRQRKEVEISSLLA
jgi:hypothetical protein